MLVDGEEKEPLTPVMVKLPKPDVSEDMLYIVHFMDNGGMELIKHEIVGNKIEFRANAFSSYALLNAGKKGEVESPTLFLMANKLSW